MKRQIFAMTILVATLQGLMGGMPSEVTKTSKEEFDIPAEVVKFYKNLVAGQTEASTQVERLIKESRGKDEAPAMASEQIVPVEWMTENYDRVPGSSADDPYVKTRYDCTYLAFQQIYEPFHFGYTASRNAVAKFKVSYRATERKGEDDGTKKMIENTITIKFEGFVDVELKAAK